MPPAAAQQPSIVAVASVPAPTGNGNAKKRPLESKPVDSAPPREIKIVFAEDEDGKRHVNVRGCTDPQGSWCGPLLPRSLRRHSWDEGFAVKRKRGGEFYVQPYVVIQ